MFLKGNDEHRYFYVGESDVAKEARGDGR